MYSIMEGNRSPWIHLSTNRLNWECLKKLFSVIRSMATLSILMLHNWEHHSGILWRKNYSFKARVKLIMIKFCLICHAYNNTSSTKATASSVPLDLPSVEVMQMIIELRSNLIMMTWYHDISWSKYIFCLKHCCM